MDYPDRGFPPGELKSPRQLGLMCQGFRDQVRAGAHARHGVLAGLDSDAGLADRESSSPGGGDNEKTLNVARRMEFQSEGPARVPSASFSLVMDQVSFRPDPRGARSVADFFSIPW